MIAALSRILPAVALAGVTVVSAAEVRRDVEYGRAGGERLLLDACVPDGAGPFPVVILVHGGGWRRGDKAGSDVPGNGADITPWFAPLTHAGFAWLSINYRLAPAHRWPACLEDLQTAVRWAKAHVAEFRGDPRRIAIFGHSAGGHLATMLATRSADDTRVQAVVGFAAVTDHEQSLAKRGGLGEGVQALLNLPAEVTPQSLNALRAISPINRVRPGMPPILLLHGEADETVAIAQSVAFQKRVRAAGNTCDLIALKGAPHGLLAWEKVQPDYRPQLIAWLKKALGE
ncbi:MAG: alpha/beta hydrolase [Opitutaceae bacterium]|nr:alpha/beta hydrolase [Opitutaceae bacterium]